MTGFDGATANKHFYEVQSSAWKNLRVYAKTFNLPIDYINEIAGLYLDRGELITGRDKISKLYKALSLYNKKNIAYANKLLTEQVSG